MTDSIRSILIDAGEGRNVLAGMEWSYIDSNQSEDIDDFLTSRKDSRKDKGEPKAAYTAISANRNGAYALGVIGKLAGIKKDKSYSLAAVFCMYAEFNQVTDALFAIENNNNYILIAIKNGLPFYDSVFETQDELSMVIDTVLPNYDMGCTRYGNPALSPSSAIAELTLDELTGNSKLMSVGLLVSTSNLLARLFGIIAVVVVLAAGLSYYQYNESQKAALAEAIRQAQIEAERAAIPEFTPQQVFDNARSVLVREEQDCTIKSMDSAYKTAMNLLVNYGGFELTSIIAECKDGFVTAAFSAKSQGDLYAYRKDPQFTIGVDMESASIRKSFEKEQVSDINISALRPWSVFLAETGTNLRKEMVNGVKFSASSLTNLPFPKGVNISGKEIMKGALNISGDAKQLPSVIHKYGKDVNWKTFSIVRGVEKKSNGDEQIIFNFQLTGNFYVAN